MIYQLHEFQDNRDYPKIGRRDRKASYFRQSSYDVVCFAEIGIEGFNQGYGRLLGKY